MKNKVIATILATTITCAIFAISGCATERKENNNPVGITESVEIMPHDSSIDDGNINNITGFNTTYKLNKDNGKYVNLYVENNGSNDVVATINDSNKRTFKSGEKGHISVEVTQGDKEYMFEVHTGKNGGTVNIYYKIAQRDK